jgi:hypothetical protein
MPLLIIITICIQEINTARLVSAKQKNRLWDYVLALIRKDLKSCWSKIKSIKTC